MPKQRNEWIKLLLTILVATAAGYGINEFFDQWSTAARWQVEGIRAAKSGDAVYQAWWDRPPSLVALEVWVSTAANFLVMFTCAAGVVGRLMVGRSNPNAKNS